MEDEITKIKIQKIDDFLDFDFCDLICCLRAVILGLYYWDRFQLVADVRQQASEQVDRMYTINLFDFVSTDLCVDVLAFHRFVYYLFVYDALTLRRKRIHKWLHFLLSNIFTKLTM